MTENEILKDLQNYQGILKAKTRINAGVNPEIALNALTEAIDIIEQYRAIGTVEECRVAVGIVKKMYEHCEGSCGDCPYHNPNIPNKCMNDLLK